MSGLVACTDEKCCLLVGKAKEEGSLWKQGVDGMLTLKLILKKGLCGLDPNG
jgi:hypothetical protein